MKDRLDHLREKIKTQRLFYSRYNPSSEKLYDVEEAEQDFRWMIHEIERLRLENEQLKEFVAYTRQEITRELKDSARSAQSAQSEPGEPKNPPGQTQQKQRSRSSVKGKGKSDKKF